ncbi:MAG: methylated-DNA--[protein]-cysteine S-methyltransferase, partial [Bacteroidales bacterium]|nr:methylated-DNA--[protein]-cysteine S-methyltransferase [Bacteroidales bacterium]
MRKTDGDGGVITLAEFESPLGLMIAGATEEGICLLEFEDNRPRLEKEIANLEKLLSARSVRDRNPHIDLLSHQVDEYFRGSRKVFTVPLITPGSLFQQEVWQELVKIPYGSTRSYMDQAKALGKPDAIRAIAHANGMNRISIIIPCHRVIGSDGKMTGYGGGIWRKKKLLDLE